MQGQILGLITPVTAVIFCLTFLVLWHRGKMGSYVLAFAAGYLFFTLGFVATHVLPTDAFYTWHLTQFFYTLSVISGSWGMLKRVGQPTHLGIFVGIYALAAVTLGLAMVMSPDIGARLIVINIAYGCMKLVCMMGLIAAPKREAIDRLIIFMQGLIAAQFLIRPSITLMVEQAVTADVYRETLYYTIVSFSLTLITLLGALVLVGACVYDQIKAVRESAELDMLTGLRTRRGFEQEVLARMDEARQENVPVALVVADLDHFKSVNDVWGHQVGDRAIAAFGEVINRTIRDHDIAGRIGGEEFCVLAWNCDGAAAVAMAERIRHGISTQPVEGMPDDHRLSASFGVAGRREGEGYGKVFARADAALYTAKQEGRNRTVRGNSDGVGATISNIISGKRDPQSATG
ncbi:GGDEF domain-containing protein [Qipengyuania sphaerica]|uniref:GGDEF domain-containing protein n=1 Tax=Qipengyuania sphaerica TaxID=2867243 RepID=UPI001C877BC3|nr:GGDEF domain-containing protein [Qipengyuania sphaerica]MBX7540930.1 GGDEF domain-containing protein [Qipengyuania sphaerica]